MPPGVQGEMMTKKNEKKLFDKYPLIFRQKDLPMTDTCMCWGIACGDGWFNILDVLCGSIQSHIKHSNTKTLFLEATQVKEKFGGLRFYADGGDKFTDGLIVMAEGLSERICEECGAPGTQNRGGWISTLCDSCRSRVKS